MQSLLNVACLSILGLAASVACSSSEASNGSSGGLGGSGSGATAVTGGPVGSTTGSSTGVGATSGATVTGTTGAETSVGGASTAGATTTGGLESTTGLGGATTTGNPTTTTGGPLTSAGFDIQVELASDLDSAAPTTVGIVTWSVDVAVTSAQIEFGPDTNYGMTAPVDLAKEGYRTLLLGMKPETDYHFRVVASDGATNYGSEDQTVTTGASPSFNPLTRFVVSNPDAVPKGFFVTAFARGSDTNVAFVFDTDGDLVWWYSFASGGGGMSGITRARMSADGESMWAIRESLQGAALERVTMDGLSPQTYSNVVASHDITPVTGEIMAYLDYGESDCDSIFEIDNAGNTQEVFESTNVTGTAGSITSCHGNAVRYSMTEDAYTFSDFRQDVAAVSRSGELMWKLSDLVSGGNSSWGGAQHGHHLLENSIVIFANDGANNGSAAIEYGLDGTEIQVFRSGGGSTNFGDVQRLSNGNTIITYSTDGLIQEVDADDNVVLEAEAASAFGYVSFRDSMYGLPLDLQL